MQRECLAHAVPMLSLPSRRVSSAYTQEQQQPYCQHSRYDAYCYHSKECVYHGLVLSLPVQVAAPVTGGSVSCGRDFRDLRAPQPRFAQTTQPVCPVPVSQRVVVVGGCMTTSPRGRSAVRVRRICRPQLDVVFTHYEVSSDAIHR